MRSISGLLFIGSRVRFVGNQTYIGVTLRSLDELAQEPGMSNPTLNGRISNTILLVVAPFSFWFNNGSIIKLLTDLLIRLRKLISWYHCIDING